MTGANVLVQLKLLPGYLSSHLLLTVVALAAGIAVCLPLGCLVTRVRALQWPTLTLAGVLQTIPGIALLALMVPLLGTIGFIPALIALILYSFLPILRNTVTGILEVDPAVKEAARGIGMNEHQLLLRVELPLALPVIVAGIRTATVWVVGTATLATPVGATSLGNYIFSGLQTQNLAAVVVGCISAAGLAILLDQLVHLLQLAVSRRSRPLRLISGALLLILLAAGIAPAVMTTPGDRSTGPLLIGSKPFTEQYVLAATITNLLNDAGYEAESRPGMGSIILFEALADGSLDAYVDYTGTIWTNVLKREDLPPREVILREMTESLDQNHGIVCLGPLGFENTYALALRGDMAREAGFQTIADLATMAPQLTIGSDYEFFSRPEWQALSSRYGLSFRQQRTLDPTLMYGAVAAGEVDVISAYSTDGRIAAFDLAVLDDPLQALPPYDAVLLLSTRAAEDGQLVRQLSRLIGAIDDNLMRRANKLVDVDGVSVDSAAAFLQSEIQGRSD